MTSRELEILNIIYRLGGRCPMRIISKETGLSSDYAFLITKKLLDQKLIKKIAYNVFILTNSGRSFLERRKGGSKGRMKTPTLLAVSRSFGRVVEPLFLDSENQFINKKIMPEQSYLTEHNLGKRQITEVADARSIQKSIKRLTFAKGLPRRQAGRKLIRG